MPPEKFINEFPRCAHCGVRYQEPGKRFCAACVQPALFDSVCNFCGQEARKRTDCFQVEIALDLALDRMKATPYKRDGAL